MRGYNNNIITIALIHYRNINFSPYKTNSSVNHCTIAHIPRPIICHCMHWHTVNHYIQTQYIIAHTPVPLKTNVIRIEHLKLMKHAKHVKAKGSFPFFFRRWNFCSDSLWLYFYLIFFFVINFISSSLLQGIFASSLHVSWPLGEWCGSA